MLSRKRYRQANCSCVLSRGLIKERNAELPVYIESNSAGVISLSQRHLSNTYPVISGNLERSGNRVIDPIQRLQPFFTNLAQYNSTEEAMRLMMSTLETCQDPRCPDYGYNPRFESYVRDLQLAASSGDPWSYASTAERCLNIFEAFGSLQRPWDLNDRVSPRPRPRHRRGGSGIGVQIEPLIREMAIRLMPHFADAGPDFLFRHLLNQYNIDNGRFSIVEEAIENLRQDERWELYDLAEELMFDGDIFAWKIVMTLLGEPVDNGSLGYWIQQWRQLG